MHLPADKFLNHEYRSRLNRTIDYIQNHYSEDLCLSKLAEIACFSKFHFHRIFLAVVGETVNDFVRRVRMEKSVWMLTTDVDKPITQIALNCGFCSSQSFSKMFKAYYGVTPSIIRNEFHWDNWKMKMKNLKEKDTRNLSPGEAFLYDTYFDKQELPVDVVPDKSFVPQVRIENMPDLRVAYVRSRGAYSRETIRQAFEHLWQWAIPGGYVTRGMKVLSVMWSFRGVTPEDKLIHDACMTVSESVCPSGGIGLQQLSGGKFAVHHCEVKPDNVEDVWMSLILNWLASSDYQPDDRPAYQIYYNDSETHPLKYAIMDLCLPIKSLLD